MNANEKKQLEDKILKALQPCWVLSKHEIRRRVYPVVYPVIDDDEVYNALQRLVRRGRVIVDRVDYRGYWATKMYRLSKECD